MRHIGRGAGSAVQREAKLHMEQSECLLPTRSRSGATLRFPSRKKHSRGSVRRLNMALCGDIWLTPCIYVDAVRQEAL